MARIRKMKTILAALVFLLLISGAAGAACFYDHPPTLAEEFRDSQSVFIGKVLSETPVPASGLFYEGQNYLIEIQEILKGNPSKTLTVFSENSTGRFPMTVQETYIVLLYYYDSRYSIDNCGNSGLLSEKQSVLSEIRLLKKGKSEKNKKP